MSHNKRRGDDGVDNRSQFHKKIKNSGSSAPVVEVSRSNAAPRSDPLERFYVTMIKCRSLISSASHEKIVINIADLLSKLLGEARAIAGGKVDLTQFMTSVHELRSFQTRTVQTEKNILRLTKLLDDCYYTLYYCLDVHARANVNQQRAKLFMAPPHIFFTRSILSADDVDAQNSILSSYLERNVSQKGQSDLVRIWGNLLPATSTATAATTKCTTPPTSAAGQKTKNPLLDLHFVRWRESICLLTQLGLIPDLSDVSKLTAACRPQVLEDPSHATMKGADPLLPPHIRQWNDGCRIWPCHLYSFATPTVEALAKICSFAPVLEIGAGTGYWAHMLRTFSPSTQVVAYDKDPFVSQGKVIKPNDYHGGSKAWTNVLKGGPDVAANHSSGCLLLCYPPPDNAMGLLALRAYKGNTVCYVGK